MYITLYYMLPPCIVSTGMAKDREPPFLFVQERLDLDSRSSDVELYKSAVVCVSLIPAYSQEAYG